MKINLGMNSKSWLLWQTKQDLGGIKKKIQNTDMFGKWLAGLLSICDCGDWPINMQKHWKN